MLRVLCWWTNSSHPRGAQLFGSQNWLFLRKPDEKILFELECSKRVQQFRAPCHWHPFIVDSPPPWQCHIWRFFFSGFFLIFFSKLLADFRAWAPHKQSLPGPAAKGTHKIMNFEAFYEEKKGPVMFQYAIGEFFGLSTEHPLVSGDIFARNHALQITPS